MARALLVVAIGLLCLANCSLADEDAVDISSDTPKASAVKELDTGTFEHLTQSSTGATTGDWFVEFYAPWCGHCKNLEPVWEEVAEKMLEKRQSGERSAIIAKVEATRSKYLAKRFEVKGFPTLIMFSQGKQYKYAGERNADELLAFAMGGFKETAGVPVMLGPNEMNQMQKLQHWWKITIQHDIEQIWSLHKAAFFAAVGASFLLGIIIGRATVSRAPDSSSKKNK